MKCELDWISGRSRLFPNHEAVVDADTYSSFTYKELNTRAEVLAKYFLSKGIEKGDRVALLAPNHISYFDFLFACSKLGAIFIPLNWRLSEEEQSYILTDSNPKLIGIHETYQHQCGWINNSYSILPITQLDYMKRIEANSANIELPHVDVQEEDPLAIMYTGGTTGKPKGVVLSHNSILWNALNTIISWNLQQKDTTLVTLPMFHAGGLNALSVPLLMSGGKVVLSQSFDPEKVVEDLIRYKCTIVLFVPTMYHMIVRTNAFQQASFKNMKVFLSGGAPCPRDIYDTFEQKGLLFKEGYGLTEAGPNNFYINPYDARRKPGSVGKPMMFNTIKIVGADGSEVKPNEVGELLLQGNYMFEYYWNKPEATKEAIIDGWLCTGDLAKQDEEGYVYIVGRKKEMIITGGENVYPLEIEHCLQSHQEIDEVAVVGLPDKKWGEAVTAYVTLHQGSSLTIDELQSYCKQKLTSYKVPKHIHIHDQLPKTHVGKIDKTKLVPGTTRNLLNSDKM